MLVREIRVKRVGRLVREVKASVSSVASCEIPGPFFPRENYLFGSFQHDQPGGFIRGVAAQDQDFAFGQGLHARHEIFVPAVE